MEGRRTTLARVAQLCGDRFTTLQKVGMFVTKAKEDPGLTGAVVRLVQPCLLLTQSAPVTVS